MPTKNINFTDAQDAFIEKMIKTGKYQNTSEAVRDAVRGWQKNLEEDELKLAALRKEIQKGIDASERGDYTEVAEEDLGEFLNSLASDPE